MFRINSKGELFTRNLLNYKNSKEYRFEIGLLQNCPLYKSFSSNSLPYLVKAKVIVQIADVNDNSPIFKFDVDSNKTISIQIYENMRAGTVLWK